MILDMAWRNVWRNRRRTILSIIVIAFSTAALLLFMAIINGFHEQIIESSVNTFNGYIQINREGFFGNETIDGYIENHDLITQELESIEGVKAYTTRVVCGGLVSYRDLSFGAVLVGIDPQNEPQVTVFHRGISRGRGRFLLPEDSNKSAGRLLKMDHFKERKSFIKKVQEEVGNPIVASLRKSFSPSLLKRIDSFDEFIPMDSDLPSVLVKEMNSVLDKESLLTTAQLAKMQINSKFIVQDINNKNFLRANRELLEEVYPEHFIKIYPIIIGSKMALRLNADIDTELTIVLQGLSGSMEAAIFKVVGIFDVGNPEFNGGMVVVPEKVVAELVGYGQNKTSQIIVRLDYSYDVDEVVRKIKDKLQPYKTFYQRSQDTTFAVTQDSFLDIASFVYKLKFTMDTASVHIAKFLSAETLKMLDEYDEIDMPSPQLKESLIKDINVLLGKESFFDDKVFSHVRKPDFSKKSGLRKFNYELLAFSYNEIDSLESDFVVDEQFRDEFVESKEGIETQENFEVLAWKDMLIGVIQFIKIENIIIETFLSAIFLAVFIIIFNVMTMSVMERKKEFGVMKAIGVTSKRITYMILLESFFLTGVALIVGCIVGLAACSYLYFSPIFIESFVDVFRQGMLKPSIIAIVNADVLMQPISLVIFTALVAPLYPIWKISRMAPVDAIHNP
ncbi:ABC transporter permease [Candidatus Uabimicrobium amorphum]|uniref:ABC transporter permease n=1 Tax=Uabimicrobium amorphum TaxID=2596890 RepID=A0A5S9II68_UABAM|nr:FtsX-like permease family protein [Candidatus Uabimicrobium amorphum]BBM82288.1 ABC transporter permease [Candidatus Uabimicrobium amorphum]